MRRSSSVAVNMVRKELVLVLEEQHTFRSHIGSDK